MDIDDRISRIYHKLDKIIEILGEHAVLHARNTDSLEYHIKRTDLLEKNLEAVDTKVELVEKRQYTVEAAFQATVKLGHYLVGFIGLIAAIAEIASYFRH